MIQKQPPNSTSYTWTSILFYFALLLRVWSILKCFIFESIILTLFNYWIVLFSTVLLCPFYSIAFFQMFYIGGIPNKNAVTNKFPRYLKSFLALLFAITQEDSNDHCPCWLDRCHISSNSTWSHSFFQVIHALKTHITTPVFFSTSSVKS